VWYQTQPTLRPVLVQLGGVVGGGVVSVGLLWAVPALVGETEIATIIASAIAILVALIAVRLGLKLLVLSRTQYTIQANTFRREYQLFYRSESRELPIQQLRGHEYTQGRIQALLGFGTVRLLTAGTNHSLGFLAFEHIDDPDRVREEIRRLTRIEPPE
jgi:membrane protein YdbS with pleckstrin-like domain